MRVGNYKRKNVVRVTGGLGNQLSAYAYARCVAGAKGAEVRLDLTPYQTAKLLGWPMHNGYELGELFNIQERARLRDIVWAGGLRYYARVALRKVTGRPATHHPPVYVEPVAHRCTYQEAFQDSRYTYYHGFFIHYRYFQKSAEELLSTLAFPLLHDEANIALAKAMQGTQSVAVHIRRADKGDKVYGADLSYYERALARVRELLPEAHFYVFSNDPAWCKEKLQLPEAIYVEHNTGQNAFRDMQLMSLCRGIVLPASTFSFWAALLNRRADAVVVCPEYWYADRGRYAQHPCPPEWERV